MSKGQEGGKLLGKGLYGCAFDPPLLCRGDQQPTNGHLVGKLTRKEEAEAELHISNKLKVFPDLAEKYFVLVDSICQVKPRSKQREPDLKECDSIAEKRLTTLRQIVMPFGGRPLRTIPRRVNTLDFFPLAQHLLEAGTLLLLAHVVHADLHQLNILMTGRSDPRLIDFGLGWSPDSLTLSNVNKLDRVFNPAINQEPPEVTVLNGMLDGIMVDRILADIQDSKVGISLLSKLFGTPKEVLLSELRSFVDSSQSFRTLNTYSYYKLYWSKVDAWSFGMILTSIFSELALDPAFEEDPKFAIKAPMLLQACRGLCRMDAGLRMDAAVALSIYAPESPLLQLPEVKEWIQSQKQLYKGVQEKIQL
jgi:hypothetical protein